MADTKPGLDAFDSGSILTAYGNMKNTNALNLGRDFESSGATSKEASVAATISPTSIVAQTNPPTPPADSKEIVREIEVNGIKQVFKAATEKELIDKLAKAQEHATRKIADLAQKAKVKPSREPLFQTIDVKTRKPSVEEQAELINLLRTDPVAAIQKASEFAYGAPADVIAKALQGTQSLLQRRMEDEAGAEFMYQNDSYIPTREHGRMLQEFLAAEKLPVTTQNLSYAFQELVTAGKMKAKTEEQVTAELAEGETVPPPPPVSIPSGTGQPEVKKDGLEGVDVAKLSALPLNEMRAELTRLMRARRT